MKKLIVTADDFGISKEVNEAVETAHKNGILTTTSLMVAEPFADDAVNRAKLLPKLGVGLHLALSRAHPASNPENIPDLVAKDGLFRANLVVSGFRFFFLPHVREQLETEIRAQFEAFQQTGLRLDHVNTHNHLHLHPTVLSLILKIGKSYGMKSVRFPYDAHSASWGALFLKPWLALMKARLNRHGVRHNDVLLGLDETGHLDSKTLISRVESLSDGIAELMCHPATGKWEAMDPMARDFRHDLELAALVDPASIKAICDNGVQLIAYKDIE